jgi:hypothetical protein
VPQWWTTTEDAGSQLKTALPNAPHLQIGGLMLSLSVIVRVIAHSTSESARPRSEDEVTCVCCTWASQSTENQNTTLVRIADHGSDVLVSKELTAFERKKSTQKENASWTLA